MVLVKAEKAVWTKEMRRKSVRRAMEVIMDIRVREKLWRVRRSILVYVSVDREVQIEALAENMLALTGEAAYQLGG